MLKLSSLFIAALCLATAVPSANADTYDITVDTSSLSGVAGSLDFEFNQGPGVTEAASLQILGFGTTTDGTLTGPATLTGDVSGALPGTLTFDNGVVSSSGYNDYFQGFTFGSTLSFEVSLYGDALTSPDQTTYTSGSTFAFSMFSDNGGTVPALTTDGTFGYAATVDVNLDGTTTLTSYIPASSSSGVTPEPSSLLLLGTGLLGLGTLARRKPLAGKPA